MACHRCGGKHKATDCKYQDPECHFCKKKSHISRACRNKQRPPKSRSSTKTHQLLTVTTDKAESDEHSLYHTKGPGTTPQIPVTLQLNGQDPTMELDTRATLSIVSKNLPIFVFSSCSTSVETLYSTAENLHGRGS